jgi:hypothetical protein
MPKNEPQITQIAAYIAYKVHTRGVPMSDAHQGWRGALRYARSTGTIDEITNKLQGESPEDWKLQRMCEALRR